MARVANGQCGEKIHKQGREGGSVGEKKKVGRKSAAFNKKFLWGYIPIFRPRGLGFTGQCLSRWPKGKKGERVSEANWEPDRALGPGNEWFSREISDRVKSASFVGSLLVAASGKKVEAGNCGAQDIP